MIDRVTFAVTLSGLVVGALSSFFFALVLPVGIAFDHLDPDVVFRRCMIAAALGGFYLFAVWALQQRKPWAHWVAGLPFLAWGIFFAINMARVGWNPPQLILLVLNATVCVLLAWRQGRVFPRGEP